MEVDRRVYPFPLQCVSGLIVISGGYGAVSGSAMNTHMYTHSTRRIRSIFERLDALGRRGTPDPERTYLVKRAVVPADD